MRPKKNGFTLVELLVVVFIVGFILFVVFMVFGGGYVTAKMRHGDPKFIEAAVEKYATDLGYEVLGKSCTSTDSDSDGYVSCSVRVRIKHGQAESNGQGAEEVLALECASGARFSQTTGCKQALMRVPPK